VIATDIIKPISVIVVSLEQDAKSSRRIWSARDKREFVRIS